MRGCERISFCPWAATEEGSKGELREWVSETTHKCDKYKAYQWTLVVLLCRIVQLVFNSVSLTVFSKVQLNNKHQSGYPCRSSFQKSSDNFDPTFHIFKGHPCKPYLFLWDVKFRHCLEQFFSVYGVICSFKIDVSILYSFVLFRVYLVSSCSFSLQFPITLEVYKISRLYRMKEKILYAVLNSVITL